MLTAIFHAVAACQLATGRCQHGRQRPDDCSRANYCPVLTSSVAEQIIARLGMPMQGVQQDEHLHK